MLLIALLHNLEKLVNISRNPEIDHCYSTEQHFAGRLRGKSSLNNYFILKCSNRTFSDFDVKRLLQQI